jgi:CheY-like chemotaxis protein
VAIGALDGMRVLLVEDNSTSRDVAVALLGRWGVEVDSAADGADALGQLAALAPGHYDLVFMDLQMPGMDGYEAITRIRAQPALAALPVYALSAHSSRGVLERCRELGMNGCLDKPYDLAELFTVLRRHYKGASAPATMPQLPAGASTLAGLEGIPGLDPDCAINDTGISPTLYPRLLAKFRDQFAGGPQGLRADVDARAWGAVVPFAHTLKGRAGLLGMSEIAAIAGRLEAAARAGDAARAQRALQALEAGCGRSSRGWTGCCRGEARAAFDLAALCSLMRSGARPERQLPQPATRLGRPTSRLGGSKSRLGRSTSRLGRSKSRLGRSTSRLGEVDVEARKVDVEARKVDVEARKVDVEARR